MHSMPRIFALAAAASAIAACSQSDDAFRTSYRTKAVGDCTRGAQSQPNPAGLNMEQLCTCMVDGYMRATPTDRLKAERDQNAPPAAANAAMQQCVQQVLQNMGGSLPGANRQ